MILAYLIFCCTCFLGGMLVQRCIDDNKKDKEEYEKLRELHSKDVFKR